MTAESSDAPDGSVPASGGIGAHELLGVSSRTEPGLLEQEVKRLQAAVDAATQVYRNPYSRPDDFLQVLRQEADSAMTPRRSS